MYHAKNREKAGAYIGLGIGTLSGLAIVYNINYKESDYLGGFISNIFIAAGIIIFSGLTGGAIGSYAGKKIHLFKKIEIDSLLLCGTENGCKSLIGIGVKYNLNL